ncbi:acetamidase/formamidase family protein [Luteimonas sp. Y-2-2-4F]|nr:acetamidase/formamidase family protein [Luteimonas sp. Y-2-2-4F]MCD9032939.1 acetamidase/formamidase family protein [Luteimonas sp. Y-2-2-4F]
MRRYLLMLLGCLAAPFGSASSAEHWVVDVDHWGSPEYQSLLLERRGDALSGTLGGDPLHGRGDGADLAFEATDARGATYRYRVRMDGDALSGQADFPDPNDPARRARHDVAGRRVPARGAAVPQRHEYVPTDYANAFDPHRAPVLTIWPGDTVRTRTLDSGGVDAGGATRALFGNPQTGPFFVVGAEPGDTLAVKIERLRPNRAYADSLDAIVGRALAQPLVAEAASLGRPRRWTLDLARGVARPDAGGGRLEGLEIPLRPMLGGLGVAPGFGFPPISSGDSGRFGGNMDFNEVVEGNIVYLPVFQPGALLYLGDAHAAQGDGETTQYALETSMDVEFGVEVLKGAQIGMPRIESPTHLMALGQAGSLDDALKAATAGLVQWLRQDYGLDLSEAAQLLGAGAEYRVATLAGRNAGMVAKLPKSMLAGLPRTPPPPTHDAR